MIRCCVCGKELRRASSWACADCCRNYGLPLQPDNWPAWARSERRREERRRRSSPSYGVSNREMRPAPYRRFRENVDYRKANGVRKNTAKPMTRVPADNLLYSTRGDQSAGESSHDYDRALESLPAELKSRLGGRRELRIVVADAIKSLPLISQRAIKAYMVGHSVEEIAQTEGIKVRTMEWLLDQAKRSLADILTSKAGADDGNRYR